MLSFDATSFYENGVGLIAEAEAVCALARSCLFKKIVGNTPPYDAFSYGQNVWGSTRELLNDTFLHCDGSEGIIAIESSLFHPLFKQLIGWIIGN